MGAPNVYDTSYVNSGPGVGLSSSGSRSSSRGGSSRGGSSNSYGNEQGYKTIEAISSSPYLAQSIAHMAQTQPAAQAIRDAYSNPANSAYSSSLFNDFMSEYGSGYDMDEYYDKIMDINKYNNQWSEAQAKKQMDYQTLSNNTAMQWSAQEAMKSREWTENLSNSAHQREVNDLVKAGLNPILAANNGAYSGSGATGQAFSSSGAMGQTDMSASSAVAGLMNGMISTARDLAITKMSTEQQKYNTDMNYAMAKLSAGASIYNNNNSVSAQKAISQLNRDADIRKASISADATRAAAATSAGAMMSAAQTNAAAAKYSADQHLASAKESAGASKYSAYMSNEAQHYSVDNNWKTNPRGYIMNSISDMAGAFSDINNTYAPDLGTWNTMGAE